MGGRILLPVHLPARPALAARYVTAVVCVSVLRTPRGTVRYVSVTTMPLTLPHVPHAQRRIARRNLRVLTNVSKRAYARRGYLIPSVFVIMVPVLHTSAPVDIRGQIVRAPPGWNEVATVA